MLRPLTDADQAQALQAHHELAAEGFTFLLDWTLERTWPQHLRLLRQYRHGLELAPGRVPATFLVARAGRDLVGRVSVRHELNSFLAELAGTSATPCDRSSGAAGTPPRYSAKR